jgi:hypothetical protein
LVKSRDQVLGSKVGVPLEHLHRLVPADRSNFLIAESSFNKSAHGLMVSVQSDHIEGRVGA